MKQFFTEMIKAHGLAKTAKISKCSVDSIRHWLNDKSEIRYGTIERVLSNRDIRCQTNGDALTDVCARLKEKNIYPITKTDG